MVIRELTAADRAAVRGWPAYPVAFKELDYALREGGWLDTYAEKPGVRFFAAEQAGEFVGFTLLAPDGAGAAEFRIAIRGDRLGEGLGCERVFLIVRKSNPRAQRVYEKQGFEVTGASVQEVQGELVDFVEMSIRRPVGALD